MATANSATGGSQVHIVKTGTCADDNLQILGGVENLGGDLIRTDNQGVHIGDSRDELGGVGIFLKGGELMSGTRHNLLDPCDSRSGERLLSSN